jgi:hypothetical protein
VELDFPEFGDPFSEQFEEEEVVLDRYGCDAELFDALPRVTCSESRQLAGLLKAWTSTAGLMISAAPSRVAAGVEIVGQRPVAMLATAPTLCMADAGTLSLPEPTMAAPRPAPPLAFADDAPMQISLDRAAPMAEHQQEIIVVEEGTPRHMNPPQPHTASANRKREFRQLFAKLRRD